jgi:hypothetical protein
VAELKAADLVRLADYVLARSDFRRGEIVETRLTYEGATSDPSAGGDVVHHFCGPETHTYLRECGGGYLADADGLKVRLYAFVEVVA